MKEALDATSSLSLRLLLRPEGREDVPLVDALASSSVQGIWHVREPNGVSIVDNCLWEVFCNAIKHFETREPLVCAYKIEVRHREKVVERYHFRSVWSVRAARVEFPSPRSTSLSEVCSPSEWASRARKLLDDDSSVDPGEIGEELSQACDLVDLLYREVERLRLTLWQVGNAALESRQESVKSVVTLGDDD